MSYIQVGINQGDVIYFYDTSLGDVVSWDWFFPGGTPTGSNSWGPAVSYNSPNTNGWNASLLVTDNAGVTGLAIGENIIVVFPEVFNVSFNATPTSSLMSQTVTYQSTGTAASGVSGSGYSWNIPGLGLTSGLSLSSITNTINDWYSVSGNYAGSPNSFVLVPVTLTVTSNVGNSASSFQNLVFYKMGPQESINYSSPQYLTSGPYYTPSVLSSKTSDLNLGGNNIILKIDQDQPGSVWDNQYFHSTDESVYFFPNTTDYSPTYSPLKFKFIWGGQNLSLAGVPVPSLPRFVQGNYIIPGDVVSNFSNSFWITDYTNSGALLTTYSTFGGSQTRQWSNTYITEFIRNRFHLSNSSKFIENAGFTQGLTPVANLASVVGYLNNEGNYNWSGGYTGGNNKHGVCVPSSNLFQSLYGISNATVDCTIKLYGAGNNQIFTTDVILSAPGTAGNSPDGMLLVSSYTPYGPGIENIINAALIPAGVSSNIVIQEESYFSCYETGGAYPVSSNLGLYDSSTFKGLRLSVSNPVYNGVEIDSIEITWGPLYTSAISSLPSQSVFRYPIAGSSTNSTAYISWLGLNRRVYRNPNTNPYFRGWKFGGSL
jgi:hypothetical protein